REAFEAESSRKSRRFFQKAHRLQAIPRSVAVEKHARIVALRIGGEQLRLHSRVELQRLLEVMFRLFVANHCGSQHTEVMGYRSVAAQHKVVGVVSRVWK